MNLFKWTKKLKPKFPNVIEKFFGNNIDLQVDKNEYVATVPSANILERKKHYEISMAVPGLEINDLCVEIKNGHLEISSIKQYQNEESDSNWMRKEYGYASFQRMFLLPENADPDKIEASMKNGVLNIKIDKIKNSGKVRHIAVK